MANNWSPSLSKQLPTPMISIQNGCLLLLLVLSCNSHYVGHSENKGSHWSSNVSINVSSCNFPSELIEKRIIIPEATCDFFRLLRCYCVTSDELLSLPISSVPHFVIGECIYGCFDIDYTTQYQNVNLSSHNGICSKLNREGILCGQCREGYGVPAYSFSLKCVHCGNESLWTTIPRYVLVAYGPLTLFLAMIVVFTVSVNSAPLRGWILVCQILSSNFLMYYVVLDDEFNSKYVPLVPTKIFASVYGVWNLDFFRFTYTPFCLHPSLTTLQVMSLDYIIAAYPLVLIVVMYVLVELYSRNFRPMVLLGRLFHHCCVCFRHRLDIRTSLIDAFGTFFSLSFVKFLSTTANLLASAEVWDNENKHSWHVYFEGSKQPFKGGHIPYAVMATLVLFFCNILPLVLMMLYSFPRGQIVLKLFPGSVQRAIYPFVDNILACYKDGTNGNRNCRFFSVVYYSALIGSLISLQFAKNSVMTGWNAYVCIVAGMLVAVIQPYKSKVYNTVDIVLTLSVGLGFVGSMSLFLSFIEAPFQKTSTFVMAIAPWLIPFLYIASYMGLKCYFKVCSLFKCFFGQHHQEVDFETHQPLLFNLPPD